MNVLARARAYRDGYMVRRMRQTPSLVEALNGRYNFGVAEPGEPIDVMVDDLAEFIGAHPDVISMEVDRGEMSIGHYGFVVARDHRDRLLARVDVAPDGALSLITPEG